MCQDLQKMIMLLFAQNVSDLCLCERAGKCVNALCLCVCVCVSVRTMLERFSEAT